MSFPFLDFESSFFTNEELLFLAGASGGGVEHTIINNPATFTTDLAKPLRRLVIPFTPVQSGSGDPSPSNVRPITGFTGLTAYHAGKNLFDQEKYSSASEYKTTLSYYKYTDPIILKPNTTYSITPTEKKNIGSGIYYVLYIVSGSDPTAFSGTTVYPVSNGNTGSIAYFTTGETGAIRFGVSENDTQTKIDAIMSVDWQIEFGSTASTYEPFVSLDSFPVAFPDGQTIYGGTLDALTGVLTVEWIAETKPFSEIKHSEGAEMKQGNLVFPEPIYVAGETGVQTKNICNVGIWSWSGITNTTPHFYTGYSNDAYKALVIVPLDMDENISVTVAAMLKTPRTVQLDPVTLSTLIGENVIWTDTNGDNTIVYLKKT